MGSFFGDVGKSLSNAGQEAVKKAKELAAVTKKRSEIRNEESKLEDVYTEIGKRYYSLYKDSGDENFREFIYSVDEIKEKIKRLNEELKELQGIKICSNCGAEQHCKTEYCSKCGCKM